MATPIPQNRAEFTIDALALATGGDVVRAGRVQTVRGVSTDTRGDLSGKAFVALRGARFDAHRLLDEAVRAGAACLVVEEEPTSVFEAGVEPAVIVVPSTLDALGRIAAEHRRRWGGRVVTIAGSAGKTTTRSTIEALLGELRPGKVLATRGNLNNRIGLPMMLLSVTEAHDLCVLEVGTNQIGEVAALAEVAQSDLGVLTLVDLEHSEGLGDLDSIEEEEGALLAALSPVATAVANGDDFRAARQAARSPATTRLTYGLGEECGYRVVARSGIGPSEITVRCPHGRAVTFQCPLLGEPGALAATAALAVAECLTGAEVEGESLSRAFRQVGEPGRLSFIELADGAVVVDDSYNANPVSVRKSIETAREIAKARGGRLWLVLGEMRELGPQSKAEHRKIGDFVAQCEADGVFAVGGDASVLADASRAGGVPSWFFAESELAVAPVLERLAPRDVALVKASRGVRAERVVEGLVQGRGRSR